MATTERKTGYLPSPADAGFPLSYLFRKKSGFARAGTPPGFADLRPFCQPIQDQLGTSSCTGQAAKAMLDIDLAIEAGGPDKIAPTSALGLYLLGRLEGDWSQTVEDGGASFFAVLESATDDGVIPEVDMPFVEEAVNLRPDWDALFDATKHKVVLDHWYQAYETGAARRDIIRHMLDQGWGMGWASPVDRAYQDIGNGHGAVAPPGKDILGNHAQVLVGYSKAQNVYLARNSWGAAWGDNYVKGLGNAGPGYAWVAGEWIESDVVFDVSCISGVTHVARLSRVLPALLLLQTDRSAATPRPEAGAGRRGAWLLRVGVLEPSEARLPRGRAAHRG